MSKDTNPIRKVIPPRGGLLHVVDAAGYSWAGFRRLWAETAARLELLGAGLAAVGFVLIGAELWHWLVLTDHISPEWSQMAKDAKDLGSLAVGLLLLIATSFVLTVMLGWL
jgi:diacylglycerol kinase (ATP)